MTDETQGHKHQNWLGTAATLVVLSLLGLFAWRVAYYANRINNGQFGFSDLSFTSDFTLKATAASEPVPDGEFNLETNDDPSLGSSEAAVTIVEFADFGCPYSRKSSFILRSLAQTYGDRIHYVYRDFPIPELHPDALKAAEAGECAQEQGKFWEYHDKLYLNQTTLQEQDLIRFAEELNLNVPAFTSCLSSGKFSDEVAEDVQAGFEAGVRGTPTFFLNGHRVPGAIPEDVLDGLIQRLMQT